MINFELQNHRPLRELVYEELKRQILIGEIAPGTRMMEVELADEMGVSRTPVREAIRKLEKEGLVSIEPRRGAYAADISIKDILDVLEVRQDLEGMAAALASQKITAEEKEEMEDLVQQYAQAVESRDVDKIIEEDALFHEYLVKCSGNKSLIQLVNQVQELSLRFRYLYYDDFSRFAAQPVEHKEICEAIISGDNERARNAMEEHISHLRDFVEKEASSISEKR